MGLLGRREGAEADPRLARLLALEPFLLLLALVPLASGEPIWEVGPQVGAVLSPLP